MSAFRDHSGICGGDHEYREQNCEHLTGEHTPDAAELADKYLDWLSQVDENNFTGEDDQQFRQMLNALAAADPDFDKVDVEASLAEFHRKNQVIFEHTDHAADIPASVTSGTASKKKRIYAPHRSAIVAAILAAIMGALVTAQALGVNVFGVVARWTTEIFRFTDRSVPYATVQTNPLAEGETRNYDTLQDAVDDFGIDVPFAPTWIPERFGVSEITATNIKDGISIFAIYSDESSFLRVYFDEVPNSDYGVLEKDYKGASDITISGIHHYFFTDHERGKAIWWNGEFVCRISGSVTEQELELMIKSIYEEIDE